jgi:hypothetical protein
LRGGEEVGSAAERIGNGAVANFAFRGALDLGDDEAPADGVEDVFGEKSVRFVEGREAHAVGVRDDAGGRIHLVAMEEEMLWLEEGNGFAAEEAEGAYGADGGEFSFDLRGLYCVGGFAKEAEEDGAVGAVADSSEGERAIEIDDDAGGAIEEIFGIERVDETQGGTHGADGVGAGGADADLEEFEETGVHAAYCRRGREGLLIALRLVFFSACLDLMLL